MKINQFLDYVIADSNSFSSFPSDNFRYFGVSFCARYLVVVVEVLKLFFQVIIIEPM